MVTEYTSTYLAEAANIARTLDATMIDRMVDIMIDVRDKGGRLFFLGVGGGAGNATHAVNDFRKIAGIESYAPTDNVAELTARVNDDGWDTSFSEWLKVSKPNEKDAVCVFSVGGGNLEKNVSVNIINALKLAQSKKTRIVGIVGRDGGYTATVADACVIVPTQSPHTVTPHAEAFQAVVWHLIVSHPKLKQNEMKWESI